jgi:hypothetical protein
MEAPINPQVPIASSNPPADKLEGIAFQFCKIATVSLIAGRFTLPVAAGLCAVLYVVAYVKGKRDSRCVLRYPLVIAGVWGAVTVAWIALAVSPALQEFLRRPFSR